MASIMVLQPERTADGLLQAVTLPVPVLGAARAKFFAVITAPPRAGGSAPQHHRRGSEGYRALVATAIENIAGADDLPTTPDAWLAAVVARVHTALRDTRKRAAPLSACLGISSMDGGRRAVALTASGAMAVRLVARDARGAITIAPVIAAEPLAAILDFTHAIDGTLGPHDALLIGPTEFHDALHPALLRRAFASRTPGDAVAALARALREAPHAAPGLIVCGSSIEQSQRSHASMETFLRTAYSTETFLTPKLGPVLRRYAEQVRHTMSLARSTRAPRRVRGGQRQRTRHRVLPLVLQTIRLAFHTVAVALRSAGAMTLDALRLALLSAAASVRVLRRAHRAAATAVHAARAAHADVPTPPARPQAPTPATLRARLTAIPERARRAWSHMRSAHATSLIPILLAAGRTRYAALPRASQRLLLLTIAFALLFAISTGALWRRQIVDADVAAYNTTIAHIEELRSVGEARLLFGDRIAARDAFTEASSLVTTLPDTSRTRRDHIALLSRELAASLDRARLLTRIARPLEVTRAGAGIPFAAIGGVTMLGSELAVLDAAGASIARVNLRSGDATTVALVSALALTAPVTITALDDRSLLLIDREVRAAIADARTGAVTPVAIDAPPPRIADATVFRGRLYLLHEDGAVTRHDRTAGGFSRGSSWLRSASLPNPGRIMVNGALYASSTTGALARFVAGRASDVDLLEAIDPPLSATSMLASPPDAEVIAVGVPSDGRVVLVRDDGRLVSQVQSDAFRSMIGIAADPTGTSLYVATGSAIYVVAPAEDLSRARLPADPRQGA